MTESDGKIFYTLCVFFGCCAASVWCASRQDRTLKLKPKFSLLIETVEAYSQPCTAADGFKLVLSLKGYMHYA